MDVKVESKRVVKARQLFKDFNPEREKLRFFDKVKMEKDWGGGVILTYSRGFYQIKLSLSKNEILDKYYFDPEKSDIVYDCLAQKAILTGRRVLVRFSDLPKPPNFIGVEPE